MRKWSKKYYNFQYSILWNLEQSLFYRKIKEPVLAFKTGSFELQNLLF
ncbi:hypothetical protein HMPREF0653_01907 [Prevotella disiens JCM 6334 = ATCC 29426]|uniref:Uncharacterized protein n=1 Tax=Prevotella disiens JCM 6334 = ATCC 29426 TaxID=1235811 RepID=A0ABP2Y5Q2_9BACT|nr:hypothetical protein HMPREF0653_01907 [Prevotella disiens JCM 6334 = ATCC 29426]